MFVPTPSVSKRSKAYLIYCFCSSVSSFLAFLVGFRGAFSFLNVDIEYLNNNCFDYIKIKFECTQPLQKNQFKDQKQIKTFRGIDQTISKLNNNIYQSQMQNANNNSHSKEESLVRCPQCNKQIKSNQIKNHIISCKEYVPTYIDSVCKFTQSMSDDYVKFMIAEMDIIKDKLERKVGVVNQEKKQSSKKKAVIDQKKDLIFSEKKQDKKINSYFNKLEERSIGKSNNSIKNESSKKSNQIIQPKQTQLEKILFGSIAPEFELTMKIDQPYAQSKQHNFFETQKISEQKEEDDIFEYLQKKPSPTKIMRESLQKVNCANELCTAFIGVDEMQKFVYLDECLHQICRKCLQQLIKQTFVRNDGDVRCPFKDCRKQIPIYQMQEVTDFKVFQDLNEQLNRKGFNFIKCTNCKEQYEFLKGRATDAPKKTLEGKQITHSMALHFAENRFLCPKCKQQQCKQCKKVPYHLGFNCEQNRLHLLKKKCRYCQSILPLGYLSDSGISTFDDICDSPECLILCKQACSKRLKCGHPCNGFIGEKNCLPCLKEKCTLENTKELLGLDQNQFCNLCFVEKISESPCIRSKCGHIFHLKCLRKKVQLQWGNPRINFKFCECPLCSAWLELPTETSLHKILDKMKIFKDKIETKAFKRLEYEGQDKNQKLTDKKSPFYNQKVKYAMTIYAYFQCYQCKEPYFGGRRSCAEAMDASRQGQEYNPKQLICSSCCPVSFTDCKKHGKEFISFKCKFCCSIGQWFCWGNTHFCDECHKKQLRGQYVTKIQKDKLPKCQGKGKCPIGGGHGSNGEEKSLGCALCIQDRKQPADF